MTDQSRTEVVRQEEEVAHYLRGKHTSRVAICTLRGYMGVWETKTMVRQDIFDANVGM